MPRVGRMFVAALMLLVLAACSTQFAYNRLDWLTHYYLANRVSLDDTQSRALRVNLQSFFAWHRRSELPRYADFLERFAQTAAVPLSAQQLEAGRREIEAFVRASVARGAPDAARWLEGLRDDQLDELFASFARKEREERQERCAGDPAERRAENVERFIENVEDWTGSLRRSQRELIEARLTAFEGDGCREISAQERTRLEFRALIDRYRSHPDFAARIAQFMTRPEDRWDAEYRREQAADRARYLQLFAEINRSLSVEQRARAVKRLRNVAADLNALARAAET